MKVSKIKEQKIWQWKIMEYLLYILVFLAPLYFCNAYKIFSFGAPKEILIIGIVLMSLVLFAWGIIDDEKFYFRFTPAHIVLGIFLLFLTVSSVFGVDPFNSFFGKWTEGISLILIYSLAIFSFLIAFLIKKNKKILNNIILVSFISSIFVTVVSYFGSHLMSFLRDSTSSTLGNSSYTGAYLIFNICFGVILFLNSSKIWEKMLAILGTLFIVFSPVFFNKSILLGQISLREIINNPFILFGTANAASLGLGVSFIVILIFFFIFSSKKLIKITGLVLLVVFLTGTFYTGHQLLNSKSSLYKNYVAVKDVSRFVAWDIAKESFYTNPILGSGFNNFSYTYQKYFRPEILEEKNPEFYFNQPHNIIFEYCSNNGIMGLLSYLSLIFVIFFYLFKRNSEEDKKTKNIKLVLIGLLFGYFVQNLFGFDTPITYLMFFTIIGIVIGINNNEWSINFRNNNIYLVKVISIVIITISLTSLYLFFILPIKEFRTWGKIVLANNIIEKMEPRDRAQSISLIGGVYDSSYLALKDYELYQKNLDKINETNRDLFIKEIDSIISQLENDAEKQPYNDTRPYILISQFVNMKIYINGKFDETLWNKSYDNLNKALSINDNNTDTYLILSQTYLLKKDFKNVYLSIRHAIEINPGDRNTYEYAHKILSVKPDKDFQKYIEEMESKYKKPIYLLR